MMPRNVNNGMFSSTYSNDEVHDFNRLSGAQHPTAPKVFTPDLGIRVGARQSPQQAHNSVKRAVAGSVTMLHVLRQHPNSLVNQRASRASSRGYKATNIGSRQGAGAFQSRPKPVAGTTDTYAAGSGQGRNSANLVKVTSHYVGFHRIIVTTKPKQNTPRKAGTV